jgi:hypothetical protein
MASPWNWNSFSSEPLYGRASTTELRVRLNKLDPAALLLARFSNGRNPFCTILRAQLSDEGIGTRVSCRFMVSSWVLIGHSVATLLITALLAVASFNSVSGTGRPIDLFLALVIPAVSLTSATFLRSRAIEDRPEMLDLLRAALDAEAAEWPIAGPLLQKPN